MTYHYLCWPEGAHISGFDPVRITATSARIAAEQFAASWEHPEWRQHTIVYTKMEHPAQPDDPDALVRWNVEIRRDPVFIARYEPEGTP